MSSRTSAMSIVMLGTLVAGLRPLIGADGSPATVTTDLGSTVRAFLPDESFAAIFAYPQRVLRSAPHLLGHR